MPSPAPEAHEPRVRTEAKEAEAAVAAVVALAERRNETARLAGQIRPRRLAPLAAALATIVCGALWFVPVRDGDADPGAGLTRGERQRALDAALAMQAEQIRVFASENGRLPASMDEVVRLVDSVRYEPGAYGRFVLLVTQDGLTSRFDSGATPDGTPPLTASLTGSGTP